MNQFRKQLYLTPVLFVTLLLCTLAHWLLEPIAEWLDIGSISVYVYMTADVVIVSFLLLPRIRLIIHIEGFRKGNNSNETPSFMQIMASILIFASLIMLPFAAVNWINKIGKTANITNIDQVKKGLTACYIALSPEVLAQLRPKPAQPVNYMNNRVTYRYAYYSVFAPSDSTFNFVWLPCFSYSQDTFSSNMEQIWRDTLNAVFRAQSIQYFRSIGASADKNKYYSKSLNMPTNRPVFFEKIADNSEQENVRGIFNLVFLLVGSLLFYSAITWILPLNLDYADHLLQNEVPWWNPLIDRRVIPFRKYG
jgi:hypothetical protein